MIIVKYQEDFLKNIISDKKFNNLYVYSVINNPYKIYE